MSIKVTYFETARGDQPVRDYVESLPDKERAKVKALIDHLNEFVKEGLIMKTSGDFHKDLARDLKKPAFAVLFKKEKERLRLAERLRGAMMRSHLSVRKVASLMGTSKSQVERLISDSEANIGLDTLIKFASVVGRRVEISIR